MGHPPHSHDPHDEAHGHSHAHDEHDEPAGSATSTAAVASRAPHGDAHGHDHGHDHDHDLRGIPEAKLRIAFIATLLFMFVEIAFGLYTRSLTLTSDAGHMFADAGSLLLALIAQRFAARTATAQRTYGFRRAETLAAFINGAALTVTAVAVVLEAWERWWHPAEIRGLIVVIVGSLGLAVNLVIAWVLARGAGHNLNTRAALAHVAFDAIGSVVAVSAGFAAWRFGWMRVDSVLSIAMAGLILFGAWLILKRAIAILMEGTPAGLDVTSLEKTIRATPGVADIHDLHAWTISEGFDSVTVHVVLASGFHGIDVSQRVGQRIRAVHQVAHVTVQPEAPPSESLRPARSLVHRSN